MLKSRLVRGLLDCLGLRFFVVRLCDEDLLEIWLFLAWTSFFYSYIFENVDETLCLDSDLGSLFSFVLKPCPNMVGLCYDSQENSTQNLPNASSRSL